MNRDYVCGVAVFKFNKTILGDEVDVFVSGGYHDLGEDVIPPVFLSSTIDTITEYYDAIEELNEKWRKNKSWAY